MKGCLALPAVVNPFPGDAGRVRSLAPEWRRKPRGSTYAQCVPCVSSPRTRPDSLRMHGCVCAR
jgi:hypothetical protein